MKVAEILEARYYGNPIINFIQKVEIGTDDYTQFPREEIPQVVDAITRVYGQPKHEPRRTNFGGDAWREWYWEVENPESYLNIFVNIPKRAKGEKRVARLGVEHYGYEPGYVDEAVAGVHPVFDFIEKARQSGIDDIEIDPRDVAHIIEVLTRKFGKPHYETDADSIFDDEKETARWRWGDHAYEGTDFEIDLYHDSNDNTAWIEVQRWPEMHPGGLEGAGLNEARYHVHPAVDLVLKHRGTKKSGEKKFPLSELPSALKALTKQFGEPELDERTWMTGGSSRRWKWKNFQVDQYEDFAWIHTYDGIPF